MHAQRRARNEDWPALLREAAAAVAAARAAWGAAEMVEQDVAWAWLQTCLARRDLLLRLAREASGIHEPARAS